MTTLLRAIAGRRSGVPTDEQEARIVHRRLSDILEPRYTPAPSPVAAEVERLRIECEDTYAHRGLSLDAWVSVLASRFGVVARDTRVLADNGPWDNAARRRAMSACLELSAAAQVLHRRLSEHGIETTTTARSEA